MKNISILIASLSFMTLASAQITALNNGYHQWNSSEWTSGIPTASSTIFLNDNTNLSISDGVVAKAKGIRAGNVTTSTTSIDLNGGSLDLDFIILSNSATANSTFYQDGGSLKIANTTYFDFVLGSSEGASTAACFAQATFSGGSASLSDVVFDLSAKRDLKLTLDGSRAEVTAATLRGAQQGTAPVEPAVLDFEFDRRGIAPLTLSGSLALGAGDEFILKIDGSQYRGRETRFVLIDASALSGEFSEIVIEGFQGGASVYADEANSDIILTIP
jgi:hypothetical protein